MKKVSKIIIICMLITITLSILFFLNKREDKKIYQEEQQNGENKFLTLMIEKEAGTGNYEERSSVFPKEGYYFNESLSKCENGSKIKYNEKDKTVDVYTANADKCYAYFDVDKLGSICRGENMAECFTKNYKKDETIYYHDGLPDYEGMLNSELEPEDLSFRYAGAKNEVKNYICLDAKTSGNCTSPEDLYQIIGFFKNNDEQYEIKLIKSEFAKVEHLGDESAKISGNDLIPSAYAYDSLYYWNSTNGATESNNNVNMWKDSNLNKVNLNSFYYNYIIMRASYLKNHITIHKWEIGGYSNTNVDAKEIYEQEVGKKRSTTSSLNCYTQGDINTKRLCDQQNDLNYDDHIGLIYISDYMYATNPIYLVSAESTSSDTFKNNNWIFTGKSEWSISRNSNNGFYYYAHLVNAYGSANDFGHIYKGSWVRPVFYLTSDTKLKEGNGTKERPYRISF